VERAHDVVVVGGGQAGLAISRELTRAGREHIVLERGAVGQSWRARWDSFCLVLPNWTIRLPGQGYQGPEPDGFLGRDAFVELLEAYARSFGAPVEEGVEVLSLDRGDTGGFLLRTSSGPITAQGVVVATGGFQQPYRPAAVAQLPPRLQVLDAGGYRRPQALPEGDVLVLGSGQTGCQLAEELHLAGRRVVLACGRAPWQPRRIGGRDTLAWVAASPLMSTTLAELPSPLARLGANPQATGRNGGYDLHYRTLQSLGVTLAGHLLGVENGRAIFADDLADSVAFGDARYQDLRRLVAKLAEQQGLPVPEMPVPAPFAASGPEAVSLGSFGSVIVATGYRPAYRDWIRFPDAFDEMGFPLQVDGSSTVVAGLHFMGVHFQRNRASASLYGVGEDAAVLAERLCAREAVG
jgi:putative flavoprotein involved in K+ transport